MLLLFNKLLSSSCCISCPAADASCTVLIEQKSVKFTKEQLKHVF